MTEPEICEPSEERGGEAPDWEKTAPGVPLPRRPEPETQGGDGDGGRAGG